MERYKILKRIGKGSYGQVYVVTSKDNLKKYVLKRIPLCDMNRKEKRASRQEVSLIERLKHPNIVAYKDRFEIIFFFPKSITSMLDKNDEDLCIIMTYCDGGDLGKKLKKNGRKKFKEKEIMDLFAQILLAIDFMHTRKVLHRDLKSQNIFLTKSGEVKIGDFGIARVLNKTLDLAQTSIGTPLYMSPEVCNNRPYGLKSDVWSIGCILYEMCTGKHPFDAHNLRGLFLKIMRGVYSPVPYRYNIKMRDLIRKMLSTNPRKRPNVRKILLHNQFVRSYVRKYYKKKVEEVGEKYAMPSDLNLTFDTGHIEMTNLTIQMNELGIDFNEDDPKVEEKPIHVKKKSVSPVKRRAVGQGLKPVRSGGNLKRRGRSKRKVQMREDLLKLKIMEKERDNHKKVLGRLRNERHIGKQRQDLVMKRQRDKLARMKRDESKKEKALADRIMEKQKNAQGRRQRYRPRQRGRNRVRGVRGKRVKRRVVKKKPVAARGVEAKRDLSTNQIREKRLKMQKEIDDLERKLKEIELHSKHEDNRFQELQRNRAEKLRRQEAEIVAKREKKRHDLKRRKELALEEERKREREREEEVRRKRQNAIESELSAKELVYYRKEQKKIDDERRRNQDLQRARKEYHGRKVVAKKRQFGMYHDVTKNERKMKERLEKKLPPSNYDDLENDKDEPTEGDGDVALIEEYEKAVLEQENSINQLRKTLTLKYGEEIHKIAEQKEEEIESIRPNNNKEEKNVVKKTENSSESSEEDEEEDEEEPERGGALTERIKYLRRTCENCFGKEIFENLYKFYKNEYYTLSSDEERIKRMREILGNDGHKISFCHLCDELIFVENTLYT